MAAKGEEEEEHHRREQRTALLQHSVVTPASSFYQQPALPPLSPVRRKKMDGVYLRCEDEQMRGRSGYNGTFTWMRCRLVQCTYPA